MSDKLRILILTVRFGDGHLRAAIELKRAFSERGWETRELDPFLVNGRRYKFLQWLYRMVSIKLPFVWYILFLLTDRFRFFQFFFEKNKSVIGELLRELNEFKPHYVISTYPIFDSIIGEKIKKDDFLMGTAITDSISINNSWLRGCSDHYFVIDPLSFEFLLERGIDRKKIYITGFPLCDGNCSHVKKKDKLIFIYYYKKRDAIKILDEIKELKDFEIVVSCSGDKKVENLFKKRYLKYENIKIFLWIENLKDNLCEYKFAITKAGGAIVNELINSNTIPIVSYVTPGQEMGNKTLVERYGLGYVFIGKNKGKRIRDFLSNLSEDMYFKCVKSLSNFPYKKGASKIGEIVSSIFKCGS